VKCPKCQFENPADARFCNQCGDKLEMVCPACEKTNPLGSRFCNGCGQALGTEHTPHPDYSKPHSYTPKFLADKILTVRSAMEGERKLVAVLFADVANFTSLSEKLDPEEIHEIMDGCFMILMDEIHEYEGTINQFTGDGVMALFGAPSPTRTTPSGPVTLRSPSRTPYPGTVKDLTRTYPSTSGEHNQGDQ